ncbi:putative ABC transport system permease protein [Pedobacter sp. UYP30]|uniref:ABC transporter permease n=1 Tax=Pedobacter sp. UYP30 TaxID=1756400 RepID=UPI0033907B81
MLKNYIKIAWRNLLRGKVFNLINIVGLSVATACSVLLLLTVSFEFSFDDFNPNLKNIYRVYFTRNLANGTTKDTPMPEPLTPALRAEYPSIKRISRIGNGGGLIQYKEKKIERSIKFVDQDFPKIFALKPLQGNLQTMLHDQHDVVLNLPTAKAIFGDENPIGKTIQMDFKGQGFENFTVSAVTEEMPDNSSLQLDVFIRFENYRGYESNLDKWDRGNHSVYIQLNEGTNTLALEKNFIPFANNHFKKEIEDLKRDGARADKSGQVFTINLLPLQAIHFDTEIGGLDFPAVSKSYILILLAISVFILLIASINFINLNIAKAFSRAREIGVRKTLGAGNVQLIMQFCLETALICLIALLFGLIFSSFLLPIFKQTFSSHIELKTLLQPSKFFIAAAIFIGITFISGFYPAWLMLRYKTVQVLKGKVNATKPGEVRNILLVIQFSLSTLLIVCTLITWQQMRYLQNTPLGFNRTEVISIPIPAEAMVAGANEKNGMVAGHRALQLLRDKLGSQSGIVGITGAHNNFGLGNDGSTSSHFMTFDYKGHSIGTNVEQVDYDFLKTLDIKLLQGRDFGRSFSTDTNAIIINEQMAKQLGNGNVLGEFLPFDENETPMQVVGIIKNYNYRSLKENIEPLSLVLGTHKPIEYIFVRVKSNNLSRSFEQVKTAWKQLYPNAEFMGSWISENTERQYVSEQRLSNMFIGGAIIAILISCIGLLAIAIIVMVQRTKEIGVRKVLGASIFGIVFLVSKDFIKLVLLASVLAFPVAWWIMHNWLQGFAYRIEINWWIFALSMLIAITIALATVSFQAIKAAFANPVKSLRTE